LLTTQQPDDGAAEEELYRREEMLNKFGDKPSFSAVEDTGLQPVSPAINFQKAWVQVQRL
jgi:hypothetical protein